MTSTRLPSRTRAAIRTLAALALAAPLLATRSPAEEAAPAATEPAAPVELIEPAAREAVKRMVETLGNAQRMSYAFEFSYDALQDDGERLEFGSHGTTMIRRPDRLRGEVWQRGGRHLRYAWDGSQVAILDLTNGVYASTPRTGDLDSLIDFLREDVGFKLPLADLFASDLRSMLVENVVAARHVGKETLGDAEVDHVALRLRTGIDVQLWIQAGEHALPRRVILDFATADGRPQFRSDLHDWDLDPWARDSLFRLDAPKGAKRVPFALPSKRAAAAQEETR
jgi:hypothetical protein